MLRMTRPSAIAGLASALAAAFVGGCVFLDVAQQSAAMAATCTISGTVTTEKRGSRPIVVVLLRENEEKDALAPWRVVDHFALERAGNWGFKVADGRYAVSAFQDDNGDLKYQPAEAHGVTGFDQPLTCSGGGHLGGLTIAIPEKSPKPFPSGLTLPAQARSAEEHVRTTLGELTEVGKVVALTDPRFAQEHVDDGVWRPFDFLFTAGAGIYFLQPYDPRKVPVLFVHGMFGSPTNFTYLIEKLDRAKFQPWVYYYPSGAPLRSVADHLTQTMAKLEARHFLPRYAVVAHSMGGLVARGFILRHAQSSTAGLIPLFVSISSPWGGDSAAATGVSMAPAVVPVWRDMTPGSDYLTSLFTHALPPATKHHLLFTFRRNSALFGQSSDHTVTVASQLPERVQREAVRMYGIDNDHDGVLTDPQVSATLNGLLTRTF